MKILAAGDIHGDVSTAKKLANKAEKEKVGSRIQEVGAERGELIAKWERGGIGTDLIRRYREEEQRAMDTQIEKKFKLVK